MSIPFQSCPNFCAGMPSVLPGDSGTLSDGLHAAQSIHLFQSCQNVGAGMAGVPPGDPGEVSHGLHAGQWQLPGHPQLCQVVVVDIADFFNGCA